MRWSLSGAYNKWHVAWPHCGFVFIYLPAHVLYSGLIYCFDVLNRITGFPVACSPRWMSLKGAFSSFQHLGLLQIPRLSNFKEICLQNSRIIAPPPPFFCSPMWLLQRKIQHCKQIYENWPKAVQTKKKNSFFFPFGIFLSCNFAAS